jgi:hypothetical protein
MQAGLCCWVLDYLHLKNSANLGEGVKQGVISGITAAAVSEVAHGGENNASEFTTTEQLALQG